MRIRKRALGVLASLLMLVGVTIAVTATPAFASTYVSGSVACVSGRDVEGVFVHANSGGGGWGIMTAPGGTTNAVGWHYTLPHGGSYYLDVGCGGTPQNWASDNYSNNYTGGSSGLICYDMVYEVPPSLQYRCA